jgi:hypothetical protein
MAFVVTADDALTLWVADPTARTARQVSTRRLNGVLGAPCDWMTTRRSSAPTVPERARRGAAWPSVPGGPIIQEALSGREDRVATYQDLLKNPHDDALFEHYATSQLMRVSGWTAARDASACRQSLRRLAEPGWPVAARDDPRASVLVLGAPQLLPDDDRGVDAPGQVARSVATRPLMERVPWGGDAAQTGPRNPSWRADVAATLTWLEALDGGDPARDAEKRDRCSRWTRRFSGEPRTMLETEWRARGVTWARANLAIAREGNSRQRT